MNATDAVVGTEMEIRAEPEGDGTGFGFRSGRGRDGRRRSGGGSWRLVSVGWRKRERMDQVLYVNAIATAKGRAVDHIHKQASRPRVREAKTDGSSINKMSKVGVSIGLDW